MWNSVDRVAAGLVSSHVPSSKDFVQLHQETFFLFRPLPLLDTIPQVVQVSITALLPGAARSQLIGNARPRRLNLVATVLFNDGEERRVFLLRGASRERKQRKART
jgi:hypothetical protein